MKNRIFGAIAIVLAAAAFYFIIATMVEYWPIVAGLFWTLVFAGAFAYGAFRLVEWYRLDSRRPRFHPGWILLPTFIVFWAIWSFGYNATMIGQEMKSLEKEFVYRADHEQYSLEYGEMNYHGSLDKVLAKRDALLKKRRAIMIGRWWTDTDTGPHIDAYYQHDFFWWFRKN